MAKAFCTGMSQLLVALKAVGRQCSCMDDLCPGGGGCFSVLLPTVSGLASFLLCPVVLSAPDTVLIERNLGKRIDPQTGGMAVSSCVRLPCGISEVSDPNHSPHPSLSTPLSLGSRQTEVPARF